MVHMDSGVKSAALNARAAMMDTLGRGEYRPQILQARHTRRRAAAAVLLSPVCTVERKRWDFPSVGFTTSNFLTHSLVSVHKVLHLVLL